MNLERLEEALEQPVGVDEGGGLAELDADSLWFIFEAARLWLRWGPAVEAAEEVWICDVHRSVVAAPGPGGNPGLYWCEWAQLAQAKVLSETVTVCKRVRRRLLAEETE